MLKQSKILVEFLLKPAQLLVAPMDKALVESTCLKLQKTRAKNATLSLDVSSNLYPGCQNEAQDRTCLASHAVRLAACEFVEKGKKLDVEDVDEAALTDMMTEKKLTISFQRSESEAILALSVIGDENKRKPIAFCDALALTKTKDLPVSTTQDNGRVASSGGTKRDRTSDSVAQSGKRRRWKRSDGEKRGSTGRVPTAKVPRKSRGRSSLGASAAAKSRGDTSARMVVSDDSSDEDGAVRGGNPQGADDGTGRSRRRKARQQRSLQPQAGNPLRSASETDPFGGCTETDPNGATTAQAGGRDEFDFEDHTTYKRRRKIRRPQAENNLEIAPRGLTTAANHLVQMKHHGQGGASQTDPLGGCTGPTPRVATPAQAGGLDDLAFEAHTPQVSEHPAAGDATAPQPQPTAVDGQENPLETAPVLGMSGSDVATAPQPQPTTVTTPVLGVSGSDVATATQPLPTTVITPALGVSGSAVATATQPLPTTADGGVGASRHDSVADIKEFFRNLKLQEFSSLLRDIQGVETQRGFVARVWRSTRTREND